MSYAGHVYVRMTRLWWTLPVGLLPHDGMSEEIDDAHERVEQQS